MNDLRFVFAAVATFAAAFAGVTFGMPWASKGPAVTAAGPAAPKIEAARIETARVELPKSEAPKPKTARRDTPAPSPDVVAAVVAPPAPAAQPPVAAAPHPVASGDRLAQTALQAAQAYARAPCDRMAKAAFIVAAATYLRAKNAAAPDDARVHAAIKTAFETGHVSAGDFPPDLMISGRFAAGPASRANCVNSAGLRP